MTVVIGYVNHAIVAVAGGMLCIKGARRRKVRSRASRSLCAPPCPSTSLRSSATSYERWRLRGRHGPCPCPRWTRAADGRRRRAWKIPEGRGRVRAPMTWQPLMKVGPRGGRQTAPELTCGLSSRLPATCASTPTFFPAAGACVSYGTSTCLPPGQKRLRLWLHGRRQDDHHQPHQPLLRGRMTARSRTTAIDVKHIS